MILTIGERPHEDPLCRQGGGGIYRVLTDGLVTRTKHKYILEQEFIGLPYRFAVQ